MNSVRDDMDLNYGKVAPVISKRAGPKLQQACNSLAPMLCGEIKSTKGFNMPCKLILHCCLPPWEGKGLATVQVLLVNSGRLALCISVLLVTLCFHILPGIHIPMLFVK